MGTALERLIVVLKTTAGRDKFYRFLVYYSKFLVYRLEKSAGDKELITKLDKGAKNVGQARKLFRFARSLEYIQELLKSSTIKDPLIRYLTIIKSISFTFWMLADHIQWLDKVGYRVLTKAASEKVDKTQSRGWFFGLLCSLILDIIKLSRINKSLESANEKEKQDLLVKRKEQTLSLVKNGLDIWIPATRLEFVNFNGGTVGLIGTITSIIGLYQSFK